MTQPKEEMYLNESISRSDVNIFGYNTNMILNFTNVKAATYDTMSSRLLENWIDKSGCDISANWRSVIYEMENIIAIKFISFKHFDVYVQCAWWIWHQLIISSVSRSAWIHVKIWISMCIYTDTDISDDVCMWVRIYIMCFSAYIFVYMDTCVCKSELTCVYMGIYAHI